MDMTEATSLITSVGFPIVMCLLMYKYITEDSKQTRETIESLKLALSNVQSAIDGLALFIKELSEKNEDK